MGGVQFCDVGDVQVIQNPSTLRFDMQYSHTTLSVGGGFPIITSGGWPGAQNNWHFGDYFLGQDQGCGTGSNHVHETHVPPGPPVFASRNIGLYPSMASGVCNNSSDPGCKTYANNTIANSTRAFDWQG